MAKLRIYYYVLISLICLQYCSASWWLLAMPSAYQFTLQFNSDYKDQCRRMNYLVARQRELCALSKNMLAIVSKGAQMGLKECQNQFSGRRWNCSTQFEATTQYALPNAAKNEFSKNNSVVIPYSAVSLNFSDFTQPTKLDSNSAKFENSMQADSPIDDVGDVFGGILRFQSREKAYVHAISAAGVAYSITRSCTKGELPSCNCDKNVHRKNKNKGKWEWGGCSEDVSYGERLSKDFVDSNELAKTWNKPWPKMMNLHNNEAGRKLFGREMQTFDAGNKRRMRKAVRVSMDNACKCHGVSGSCTVKICWRKMQDFQKIGEYLYKKFDGATRVTYSEKRHKLKPATKGHKRPTKRDLVYLQESPDFCQENPKLGIYGTKGRKCNKDSYGTDGCAILCCGRGYTTKIIEQIKDCNCKFVWCCEVKCEKCRHKYEEHYCK